jgi:hypothetical protein
MALGSDHGRVRRVVESQPALRIDGPAHFLKSALGHEHQDRATVDPEASEGRAQAATTAPSRHHDHRRASPSSAHAIDVA